MGGQNSGKDRAVKVQSLTGLNVLLVEDEAIISLVAEEMLLALGCNQVWHAGDVASALETLASHRPDAAVLDVNLRGELVFPIAERLDEMKVPFVFTTGYGRNGVPQRWSATGVIPKPYDQTTFSTHLRSALESSPSASK